MMKRIKSVNSSSFLYQGSGHPPAPFKGGFKSVCVSLFLAITVISCSQNNLSTASISQSEKVNTFKVSDNQGAEINFKISTNNSPFEGGRGMSSHFSTKANTNGTAGKIASNVDHYVVYLIKDSGTGTYAGTDPLNTDNIVAGPFTVDDSNTAIKFTGVNSVAGAYYVAVRAQDSSNIDIIQTNNNSGTAWTGTTATTYSGKVAVSSGNGITVNSAYQVNTPTALSVTVNLANGTGAGITAQTSFNQTNTNPAFKNNSNNYIITTIAGSDSVGGYSGDGGLATSTNAKLYSPAGLAIDSSANLYIADANNNRIRKIDTSGIITTIAGTGAIDFGNGGYSGDGGQATGAQLNSPRGIAVDSSGNIYIADTYNNRIRKITVSTGIITTIAGTGTAGYTSDNVQATSSQLSTPLGVAVDNSGNVYIADQNNYRIRKVTASTGIITTIAGSGTFGVSVDGGQATGSQLTYPRGVTVDSSGNIYIADGNSHRIRKVTASTGIITTIAGTSTSGYSGDGGLATSTNTQLNSPFGVALDLVGNIYIDDYGNHRIRKVTASTGIITTIAGTGTSGYTASEDNNSATSAKLNSPRAVIVDNSGNVYIADTGNNRVRKLN